MTAAKPVLCSAMTTTPREAVNSAYDRGCDLVEAARALRGLAAEPTVSEASPAIIGCIETALADLSAASGELARVGCGPVGELSVRAPTFAATKLARRHQSLMNLEVALYDAATAAGAARPLAARVSASDRV